MTDPAENSPLPWLGAGKFPLYLAPMARFTDCVYRQLCKENGADVLVTEFVRAEAFLQDHVKERTWETVDFDPTQRPLGVQIFGHEPARMAEAARLLVDRLRPDFIDLNFGCPAPKVTSGQGGCALLRDLPRMGRIAGAVARALPDCPVTGKIRLGWDARSVVAVEAAKILESEGCRAVAIHGRTKQQGYSGDADWVPIAEAAEALAIPVIGNGLVQRGYDIPTLRAETKIAGLMLGRAALGYPWIFGEIKAELATGVRPPPPSLDVRWQTILRYADLLWNRPRMRQERTEFGWLRAKLTALTKDMPGCRQLRNRFQRLQSMEELHALAAAHRREHAVTPAVA